MSVSQTPQCGFSRPAWVGRSTAALLTLTLLLGACTDGSTSAETSAPTTASTAPAETSTTVAESTTTSTVTTTTIPAPPEGPFDGLTWPGGNVPVNALLYDDGFTLSSITLDGTVTELWDHPDVYVREVSPGPGGAAVALAAEPYSDDVTQISAILYLLQPDGTIETVDAVDGFRTLESLVFVRPPTEPDTPARLYWTRFSGEIEGLTGRMLNDVMVATDDGPKQVTVPLRDHEGVFGFYAYPGAATFALSLFRHNDVPTRLEILHNWDFFASSDDASLLLWSDNEPLVNTDLFTGVAWLTPNTYVVPVNDASITDVRQLQLFRVGCEWYGGEVFYEGEEIGVGYAEYPWPLLPGGSDQVLVLTAEAEERLFEDPDATVFWTAVDVATGTLEPTGAQWRPGAWAWVSPADPTDPPRLDYCEE